VPWVADRDPTKGLDPLGDGVHERPLLIGVLVEQEVQLGEGRPAHQPMVLLVQRVEHLRVSQELVQALAGVHPRLVREREWELPHSAKRLDLLAVLVQPRLTMLRGGGLCGSGEMLCHGYALHVC